jgi:hypothetical protein
MRLPNPRRATAPDLSKSADAPLVHEVLMHEHEGFRPHGEARAELPAADEVDL